MREMSGRSMTLAYVGALALVAIMSMASHLTLNGIVREHEGAASVVNVAGRQRMLSQRIASLVAERELGLPVDADLTAATERFESANRNLVHGDAALHLPSAETPELRAIYFGGARPLDGAVADFVALARHILTLSPADPEGRSEAERLFADAREPILTSLDEVVSVHQKTSEAQMRSLEAWQTISLAVVVATLLVEALLIFRPMVRRIRRYTQMLLKVAATDPLTGALNRRSFAEQAQAELNRAERHGRATTVLMLDADRFKAINDRYGHAGGDAVLRAFAASMKAALRPSDLLGRFGGEEFAVLLAETGADDALTVAERIRGVVESLEVSFEGHAIRFTVSIGTAAFGDGLEAFKDGLDRADAALYRAKTAGRNRIVSADPPRDAHVTPSIAGTLAAA